MSQNSMRVFGPKVFDPSLAKKILGCSYNQEDQKSSTSSEEECKSDEHVAKWVPQSPPELEGTCDDNEKEIDDMNQRDAQEYEFFNHMQEVLTQLSFERKQKEVCLCKLNEIEHSLEQFSSEFFDKLKDLRQVGSLNFS
ncbi:hypothetical protein GOP47_0005265 [Adiantum capillus-veneris]|uniref:Uncharacterized protein n=1 Tax=Adiantum capillus-veneris TaxID=13818 RepID=A0A9D4V4S8_ADICA|nr:hypothetical protein GOP47_0005265 [Adiantum capillus-veneris]